MATARKSGRVVSGPSKDPDESYDFLSDDNFNPGDSLEEDFDPDDDFEEDFGSGKRKARGSSSSTRGKGKGKAKVARKAPIVLSENEASEDEYDPNDDSDEDFGSTKRKARGSSSSTRGKGKGKAKVARKPPARRKDNRKMPAVVVVPATPAEQEALKSMLKNVNREALEKLAFDLAHEEEPVTVQMVLTLLKGDDGDKKPSAMEVVESEPLDDMGRFNGVNMRTFQTIMGFVPDMKDRLTCALGVCKTWKAWLWGEPALYQNVTLSIGRHKGPSHWMDGPGLVRFISKAPEGSIEKFKIYVDEKAQNVNRKTHVEAIFKLGKQFRNLYALDLSGRKVTTEVLKTVAETCAANLSSLSLSSLAGDLNYQAVYKLLRNAPFLRTLRMMISDAETLSKVRESLVLARGGGTPLLEEFDESPNSWYGRHKPLSEFLRLFPTFPRLRSVKMSIQLPDNELGYDVAFRGSEGPFESVKVLDLSIGPGHVITEAASQYITGFFSRMPTLFPHLQELTVNVAREYLSNKDIRSGKTYRPSPRLSGSHTFPHLTSLAIKSIDVSDDFCLTCPVLTSCSIGLNSGNSNSLMERLKPTCPAILPPRTVSLAGRSNVPRLYDTVPGAPPSAEVGMSVQAMVAHF